MNRIIELQGLIETLEQDLQNHPKSDPYTYDFQADMMQKALDHAKKEFDELTKGK